MRVYLLWLDDDIFPRRLLGVYSTVELAMYAEKNYQQNNSVHDGNTFITQATVDTNHMEVI